MLKALRKALDRRRATRLGKTDGRHGIPLPDEKSAVPAALQEIRQRGSESMWSVTQEWAKADQEPKAELVASQRTLDERQVEFTTARKVYEQGEAQRSKEDERDENEARKLSEARLKDMQRKQESLSARFETTSNVTTKSPSIVEEPIPVAISDQASRERQKVPAMATSGWSHDEYTVDSSTPTNGNGSANATQENQAPSPKPLSSSSTLVPAAKSSFHGIASWAYWSIVALIVVGELPLNALAFEVFGEARILTMAMTLGLAVMLVSCAHLLGSLLSRGARRTADTVFQWVLVLIPMLAIVAIGIVRTQYLEGKGAQDSTLQFLGPVWSTIAFALVNILIYWGATALSYAHHDPESQVSQKAHQRAEIRRRDRDEKAKSKRAASIEQAELKRQKNSDRERRQQQEVELKHQRKLAEQSLEDKKRAREEEAKHRSTLSESLAKEFEDRARIEDAEFIERREARIRERANQRDRATTAKNQFEEIRLRCEALRAQREATAEHFYAEAMKVKSYHEMLMTLYAGANVLARKDHKTPPVLRELPALEIPREIAELRSSVK